MGNILPLNVKKLITLLERLPGLGPKSSARIAMYLLKSSEEYNTELGQILNTLNKDIVTCEKCFNIASESPCSICSNLEREEAVVVVVEDPLDVLTFEKSTDFNGVYHVLGGVISPVNGIGPEDLKIKQLINRIANGNVKEIILATNPIIEGEATAMYITEELKKRNILDNLKITKLARGLPSGADLEYTDKITLNRAFEGRVEY